jgi:dTDP-4-amino-4,6-dideoxygalactose transaminase
MIAVAHRRRLSLWPGLPLDAYRRPDAATLPFPLGEENCRVFLRARHGLWHGVKAIGLVPGDEVLVPAYHHGSEVEALLRAGLRPRFFEANDTLEPDEGELESLLGPNVRALFLIHYLGFPRDLDRWRVWCDRRGLLLIEDAAQAWLARDGDRPVGSVGDLAVFCLYKMVPVPDGAALVSKRPPPPPTSRRRAGAFRAIKRHCAWLAQQSPSFTSLHARVVPVADWLERHNVGGLWSEFELGDPASPPSVLTTRLLPKIADPRAAEQRRENYRFLLERLGDVVSPAFAALPSGASPLAFPIEVGAQDRFVHAMKRRGIGLHLWTEPHPSLPIEPFPRARALRARLVGLPVHHQLVADDLDRLVAATREENR